MKANFPKKISAKAVTQVCFGVFLFLLTLGQLQRIQVTPTTAFYLFDLFILMWCSATILLDAKFRQKIFQFVKKLPQQRFFLFLVWAGIGIGLAVLQGGALFSTIFYLLRLALYALFAGLLLYVVQEKRLEKKAILLGFLLYGVLTLYFGFLQYVFMPDTRWLVFLGWDDHYYRLISTLFDPGFTGVILVLGLCLLQTLSEKKHFHHLQIGKGILSLLFMVGILLTYSRASYLAFFIALSIACIHSLWPMLKKNDFFLFTAYLLFFILAIPLLPRPGGEGVKLDRTVSIYARTSNGSAALQQMLPLDWVVGQGLFVQTVKPVSVLQIPNHAHIQDNWVIFILTGTGLVGLALFVFSAGEVLAYFYQKNVWLAIILVVIFTHGLFNASVVYPFVLLFLIGAAVSAD
jgi:hypothetical protein